MGTDSINVDSIQAQEQTSWANARDKLHSHVDFGLCCIRNKPSFCSGSCDEIHVRRKLQNKTSLQYLNFLDTHLKQNTLET